MPSGPTHEYSGGASEILTQLQSRPSAYSAVRYEGGTLAVADSACLAPDWPELRSLINRDYVREATFGIWSAFRRRSFVPPASSSLSGPPLPGVAASPVSPQGIKDTDPAPEHRYIGPRAVTGFGYRQDSRPGSLARRLGSPYFTSSAFQVRVSPCSSMQRQKSRMGQ